MIDARDYKDSESLSKAMEYEQAISNLEYFSSLKSNILLSFDIYSHRIQEEINICDNKIKENEKIVKEYLKRGYRAYNN